MVSLFTSFLISALAAQFTGPLQQSMVRAVENSPCDVKQSMVTEDLTATANTGSLDVTDPPAAEGQDKIRQTDVPIVLNVMTQTEPGE